MQLIENYIQTPSLLKQTSPQEKGNSSKASCDSTMGNKIRWGIASFLEIKWVQ